MTPEFDDGPILAQRRIAITDDDDMDTLFPKFTEAARSAHHEALDCIERGDPGVPQDPAQATYTGGAFEPAWREIDWSKPARDVFIQVRSWHGKRDVPRGAFGEIDGKRLLVTKTRLARTSSNSVRPSTVLERREDGSMLIQCGDGTLEILEWNEALDDKKPQGCCTRRDRTRTAREGSTSLP